MVSASHGCPKDQPSGKSSASISAGARQAYLIEEPMAAAIGAGLPVEEARGSMVVDIGGGTTDIAVFAQGAIRHTASLPIAGDQVTSDIAHLLRTPTPHAEEIKVRYACALAQLATAEESIQVPSVGDRPPRRLARRASAISRRHSRCSRRYSRRLSARRSSRRHSCTSRRTSWL